jgi:hypothetical protein
MQHRAGRRLFDKIAVGMPIGLTMAELPDRFAVFLNVRHDSDLGRDTRLLPRTVRILEQMHDRRFQLPEDLCERNLLLEGQCLTTKQKNFVFKPCLAKCRAIFVTDFTLQLEV